MITGTTRLYAIIGDPITHVRTPMAFNDYFLARNIDAVCLAIQIGGGDLPKGWAGLKSMANVDGFIVTSPHKAEAAELCERLEGEGRHAGVVNVVRREPDGSFSGTLLDGRGFVSGLIKQGHQVKGRRFYLAGGGGAATALAFALADTGAAALTIHNRTGSAAEKLAAGVGAAFPRVDIQVGTANAGGHDVVVNATALGLKADDGRTTFRALPGVAVSSAAGCRGRDEARHDAAIDRRREARPRHPFRYPHAQQPARTDDAVLRARHAERPIEPGATTRQSQG